MFDVAHRPPASRAPGWQEDSAVRIPSAGSATETRKGLSFFRNERPGCATERAGQTSLAMWLRSLGVPFTCDACGAGRDLIQIPAHGTVLRCPQCGHERFFVRPPLLIVTGTPGAGKSTICARLAGRIPDAVLLDADVFAGQMVSDVPPNEDYPAFWRSMTRLAHEISQNNLAVVFFSGMVPQQLLANKDVLDYFESVSFLCLKCDAEVLRPRFIRRGGSRTDPPGIEAAVDRWGRFNDVLMDAARSTDCVDAIDATRSVGEVESDVRGWIMAKLQPYS